MSEMGVQPVAESTPAGAGLTQWQRVANTFAAPSKTFEDIKRGNRSWWLPLIIGALFTYMLFGAVVQKIGIQQVVDNQIRMNPKAQERMAQAPEAQREMSNKIAVGFTEGAFLAGPAIAIAYVAVLSLWARWRRSISALAARLSSGAFLPCVYYAWLPAARQGAVGDDCHLFGNGA